ncbi:MAG: nascent polypeptide-associated complex protein [Candidatus Hadarchaeales archaeon]
MFPKHVDRRQMERLMRQMGIKTVEMEGVEEVVIRLPDREIVIPNAGVTITEMGGQRIYQVMGKEQERKREYSPSEDDVRMVMEQAGVDREAALRALTETKGDLAEAIIRLKGLGTSPAP